MATGKGCLLIDQITGENSLFGLAELDKVLEGRGLDERFTSGKNASVTSVHFTNSSCNLFRRRLWRNEHVLWPHLFDCSG